MDTNNGVVLLNNFIRDNNLDMIKKLFDEGYMFDESGTDSVKYAIVNNKIDIAKYLIEKGEYIEYKLKSITDAFNTKKNKLNLGEILKCAVEQGNYDLVYWLSDADVHYGDDIAICIAANEGHLNIVKLLVIRGADIHARDEHPLRWAAIKGHCDVVKYLLEQGADSSYIDKIVLEWSNPSKRLFVEEIIRKMKGVKNNDNPKTE